MRKYKTIAIPVTFTDDVPRFLTVRDKRFKEWIFVTGGCKKREEYFPLKCALRELEEETRGIINLKMGEYTHFKFSVNENGDILEYSVFIFFVNIFFCCIKQLSIKMVYFRYYWVTFIINIK